MTFKRFLETVFCFLTICATMLSLSWGQVKEDSKQLVQSDTSIAWVLGKNISIKDSQNLSALIIRPLLDRYTEEEHIEVKESEIEEFILRSREITTKLGKEHIEREQTLTKELSHGNLINKERKAKEEELKAVRQSIAVKKALANRTSLNDSISRLIETRVARQTIQMWKINRSLFQRYGGRVIFQQAGVEPLDAYRMFLKEQERQGNFKIFNPVLANHFWKYFVDDSIHVFIPANETKHLMESPWWRVKK